MSELQDGVAIVTGGSTGIGAATAKRFADEGASVVVADVNVEDGEDTVAEIVDAGGEATFVEVDVTDPAEVEAMVETAVDTYGGLDFAVNNAGIEGENEPTSDQPLDNWEQVIDVNLKGVFVGMQAEIDAMLEDGGGAIVNMSSIAGQVGFPNLTPYVASKHGVIGLTKTASLEYSEAGVRVNAICPGVIETPMVEATDQASIEQTIAATPIGRLGEPSEIGDAAVWLCSEEASFVTGESLVIDGGYVSQ
ncbi:3alphaor 20beta-hydroxysteroid dehydrogenase protein [Halorhabdus tiamatea SARL4B]|uniref:3alphaor 20beta-hydroxysteroid dehydrogenase protein n=1 Tax=Halorhabdus tiamatea SARL4B TaxID=1033806 RepID=F7PGE9_9EURY|nr:glucose 1-dehydrogenase [Halorhabdus tiamatea]ERJ04959.1 3alphaor 20beta-hydroxysteroid dehydrogenase protein [Halorhabdus tiamatea SARL4B]CCQ33838.1 short-chain dehydrogenase/reductase SDR [Halorhabdus tiamatea SARL4B]